MGPLSSQSVFFEGEEKDEQVLSLLRAHVVTNLGWIILSLFFAVTPFFIWLFFLSSLLVELPFSKTTFLVAVAAWELVIFGIAFQKFLNWYFNIYIITNKRIVDVDFFGIFHRRVSEATLANIEDVTYSKGGLLQNFLDYGDIHIQTAGTAENFEFYAIPDPEGTQKQILELITNARRR